LTAAEQIVLRNRAVTIMALAVLSLLGWAYILSGAGMRSMTAMGRSADFPTLVIMWSVMMVAMMVPAASPTILLYAQVHRQSSGLERAPPTAAFLAGYLACWVGFAFVAAGLQMSLNVPIAGSRADDGAVGGLLIAAGVYQLLPLKDLCLSRCRSPAKFLTRHYRPGAFGAFQLGVLHGSYCIGCCWLLMALLFVVGAMNLVWVAGLTMLVAAEKLLAGGPCLARLVGGAMVASGAALIFS
jgi:predicted metal-binding membrane protein